ncbi:MAG TPA: hypothetical protein VGY66_32355 [Gemmataceae bacterium]|jgi:hypothetical protein|nr:hypothetical protein [Gemmataceae bacterium]
MVAKRNGSSSTKPPRKRPKVLYASLAHGPTPAERRKEVEERMQRRGLRPIEDFDRHVEEVSDFWPKDESCDDFLVWLRKLRREGSS